MYLGMALSYGMLDEEEKVDAEVVGPMLGLATWRGAFIVEDDGK
jgi:hypothetical protein